MEREEAERLLNQALEQADPKLVERYGNPLDKDDPRNWHPADREEKGVSNEDRLRFAELDIEMLQLALTSVTKQLYEVLDWVREKQKEELLEQFKADPEAALTKLLEKFKQQNAVGYPDNNPELAGNFQGTHPKDALIETPQGKIRVDQIPGYRDDPDWRPSPDWVDANCMCETHVSARRRSESHQPGEPGTGFYL